MQTNPTTATPEIAEFLADCETFRQRAQPPLSKSSLSSILFGAGKQIERLESGCDLTTGRLRVARDRLRDLENGGPRKRPKPDTQHDDSAESARST